MTERKATATAKTNTGILCCAQDDGEKLAAATARASEIKKEIKSNADAPNKAPAIAGALFGA